MRRLLAILAVIGLVQAAAGCRHVAGACDCEHAPAVGAPAYFQQGAAARGVIAPAGPAAAAPAAPAPAPMPK